MAYREFAPTPPLHGLVECGWTATLGPGESPQTHHVLPDGCMDLLWVDGELIVAGPDPAPHAVRRAPGGVSVGLRFAPGALPRLLGVPAVAVRDQRVPLAELYPRLARATRSAPVDLLTEIALALPGLRADRAVAEVVAARIGSRAGVAATADALGWATRTPHRRCLESFGYGPAVLRRVLRFRRAAALLHAGVSSATGWHRVSSAAGS